MVQVAATLESVVNVLRDEYADPPKDDSLLNLGAYLTLAQVCSTFYRQGLHY